MSKAIPEGKLAQIIEMTPNGVAIIDEGGRFVYANAAAEKIFGLARGDIVGRAYNDPILKITAVDGGRFPDEDLPYARVMASREPLHGVEFAIERPDGTRAMGSVDCVLLFDEEGDATNVVMAFADITERKQAEKSLIESEERYRRLFELSPDLIVIHSKGKIVYVNPAAVKLFGAGEPEEYIGKQVLSFVHPDYRDIVAERVKLMQQGRAVGLIEEKFVRLDGRVVDVEVAATPITYLGEPSIMVVGRDVTERKRAEEELKESERRFREMLEESDLIAVMLDTQGKITFLNDFLLNLTGWQKGEVIGKDWFDTFISPEQREGIREFFLQSIAMGSIQAHYENDIVTRWGARRTISFNDVILRDPQGNTVGTASIGEDITEQKRLYSELNALSQITGVAMSTLNLGKLLDNLLKRLVEVMEADTAVILLKEGNRLLPRSSVGIEEEVRQGYSRKIGQGFAGTIAKTAKPLYVADAQVDFRVVSPIIKQRGIRTMLGVPMMREGNLIGILHVDWLSVHPQNDSELHLLEVAADHCAMAITNAQLHEKTKEAGRLINALNNINTVINSTLDFDETMRRVVEESAEAMGCEIAAIDLREGDHWVVKYLHGLPQELVGTRFTDEESKHSVLAARTKRPVVIDDVYNDERADRKVMEKYNLSSIMVVPLMVRGGVIGVLFFGYQSTIAAFNDAQVDFASKIGVAVSLALENARLYAAERNIAGTLQEPLLMVPQKIPGIDIGYLHSPSAEIAWANGDFCDIFELKNGSVGIVIGSVTGKGIEAVALASLVKNIVKVYAYEDGTPALTIAKTNDLVLKAFPPPNLVTVFFGILDVATGRLTYCSAGHPPAIIKRATSEVELLTRNSPSIGAFSGSRYKSGKGTLKKGDILIVYTDGVTEIRCNGEFFGKERLINLIKQLKPMSAEEVPKLIHDEITDCAGAELSDAVAIFTLSIENSV